MAKLTLVEGGYYRRRNGEIVGPLVPADPDRTAYVWAVGVRPNEPWCLVGDNDSFTESGQLYNSEPTKYDLVEQVSKSELPLSVLVKAAADLESGNAVTEVVGRKHDADKPWAGTVLAGFWCDDIVNEFVDAAPELLHDGEGGYGDTIVDALNAMFDTNLTVAQRFKRGRDVLNLRHLGESLRRAVDVGTYGARKYERDNWLHVEDGINRYYEACGRHVLQILEGKRIDTPDDPNDKGSGLPNLNHICWCIYAGAKLVDNLQKEGEK